MSILQEVRSKQTEIVWARCQNRTISRYVNRFRITGVVLECRGTRRKHFHWRSSLESQIRQLSSINVPIISDNWDFSCNKERLFPSQIRVNTHRRFAADSVILRWSILQESNSVVNSPFWETNIQVLLRQLTAVYGSRTFFTCFTYLTLPFWWPLYRTASNQTLTMYLPKKIRFSFIFPRPFECCLSRRFPDSNFVCISPISGSYTDRLIVIGCVTLTILRQKLRVLKHVLGEKFKLYNYGL